MIKTMKALTRLSILFAIFLGTNANARQQVDSLNSNLAQTTDSLLRKIDQLHDRAREMETLQKQVLI
jgi:ATP-dependent protease HslVU (ClpYQ) peptidase subunit